MTITIKQTTSNIKQTFDIEGEDFFLQAENNSVVDLQYIRMFKKDTEGAYRVGKYYRHLSSRDIFGEANLTRKFVLSENGEEKAFVAFAKRGFFKTLYLIALENGEVLNCYFLTQESFDYVSIYKDDKQIALIETYLNVNDFKYTHKLYLLDDFAHLAEVLAFFAVYYSSYHFSRQGRMSGAPAFKVKTTNTLFGEYSVEEKSWSFSRYKDKYNPSWRRENFPDEDFFGKFRF